MGYFVTTKDGIKIYVEDINRKGDNTIVFLHGWPGSHELFEYQYDYLIQRRVRCIGIDQRGFGKSDKPNCGYDYDTLSDDVKAVIDELNLDNFILLGHSNGGAIAIRYMARHNGYGVKGLILCAAAAPSLIKRDYFPYGIDRKVVEDIINGTFRDRPKMLKEFGDIFFYKKHSKSFMNWFISLGFQAAGWGTAEVANTWLYEEKLFEDLKKIDIDTLIIHGIHDKVCLFPLALEQKKLIKNAKLIKFKNSGHGVFYDEKDRFNKVVENFVEAKET